MLISRKPQTQQRYVTVALGHLHAISVGFVTGLDLEPGATGMSFSLAGTGAQKDYEFEFAATDAEWDSLVARIAEMRGRPDRDKAAVDESNMLSLLKVMERYDLSVVFAAYKNRVEQETDGGVWSTSPRTRRPAAI